MRSWSISEARARIAEVFEAALSQGPQKIERRDHDAVVVVSEDLWLSILAEYPEFGDVVLRAPLDGVELPPRKPARILRHGT